MSMKVEGFPTIDEIAAQVSKTPAAAAETVSQDAPEELPPPLEVEGVDITASVDPDVAKPVEAKKEEPKRDAAASKFAALARREKQAREAEDRIAQMQSQMAQQQQAFQKQMDELTAKQTQLSQVKNPLDVLKAHGFSYQDVTQAAVGAYEAPAPDPIDEKIRGSLDPVQAKLTEIESKSKKLDEALAQIQAERAEYQRQQRNSQILDAASKGGYELVATMGEEAFDLVQNVMLVYQEKHQRALSFEEACDTVETYYQSYADKFLGTQKIKSRFAPPAPSVPTKQSKPQVPEAKESPKTLTQSLTQGTRAKTNFDELSKHEALERLATQLRFQD